MPETLAEMLGEVPLFAGMPDDAVELLAGCARNVHFDEGSYLFRKGDPADSFYVIRHGTVALEAFEAARGSLLIETVGPGEVVGWSWLFEPYRWHLDARAVSTVRATSFDGACLRGKCDADAALGYDLMGRFAQVLIERLQWTQLRLLDIYGHSGSC
jgi:CRP-like cAMP-binding protein